MCFSRNWEPGGKLASIWDTLSHLAVLALALQDAGTKERFNVRGLEGKGLSEGNWGGRRGAVRWKSSLPLRGGEREERLSGRVLAHMQSKEASKGRIKFLSQSWLSEQLCLPEMGLP